MNNNTHTHTHTPLSCQEAITSEVVTKDTTEPYYSSIKFTVCTAIVCISIKLALNLWFTLTK